MGSNNGPPVMPAVQAAVAGMPAPATATPPATDLDGRKGTSPRFAREDHTHAARVQRTVGTTATDGTYRWVFARAIACEHAALPPISWMAEDAGKPLIVQIVGREMTEIDGKDVHAAVTVRAYRSRGLPLLSGISLLGALVTALAAFDVFGGSPVAGVKVNLFAADPTQ